MKEKPGDDYGLDQPRMMLSAGDRIEPKGAYFVCLHRIHH